MLIHVSDQFWTPLSGSSIVIRATRSFAGEFTHTHTHAYIYIYVHIYTSLVCLQPVRNYSNFPTRSLTHFNNFPAMRSRRIDRDSFVIVSGCNQRRGSILGEFFTSIRTVMINRYFILFGMPAVPASKEGDRQSGRNPTRVTKEERKSIVSMHSPMRDVSSIFVNIFQHGRATHISLS